MKIPIAILFAAAVVCLFADVALSQVNPVRYWNVDGQAVLGSYIRQSQFAVSIMTTSGEVEKLPVDFLSDKDLRYADIVDNHDAISSKARQQRQRDKELKRAALANARYRHAQAVRYKKLMAERRRNAIILYHMEFRKPKFKYYKKGSSPNDKIGTI
jgi:hypothetical protein